MHYLVNGGGGGGEPADPDIMCSSRGSFLLSCKDATDASVNSSRRTLVFSAASCELWRVVRAEDASVPPADDRSPPVWVILVKLQGC